MYAWNMILQHCTFDSRSQWPWSVQIGIASLVGILLSLFGYGIWIQTEVTYYRGLQVEERHLHQEVATKNPKTGNIEAYQAQLQQMQAQLTIWIQKMHTENEISGVLEAISIMGSRSGLKVDTFIPGDELSQAPVRILPIRMKVMGSYYQIAMFVSHIAQLPQMVVVHDFNLSVTESIAEIRYARDPILTAQIALRIYRYIL
ncbi:MAG: type 4a pilus biogenesis protein PilO [Legionellaceae bacterium]|nr:type 4a pilus biogenesis protein PilO [Legionellaceae bacterium]